MEVDELKEKLNQFISNYIDNAITFGAMEKWINKIRTSEKLHAFLAKEEIMHQSIPSTNIPPGLTPGEFF